MPVLMRQKMGGLFMKDERHLAAIVGVDKHWVEIIVSQRKELSPKQKHDCTAYIVANDGAIYQAINKAIASMVDEWKALENLEQSE